MTTTEPQVEGRQCYFVMFVPLNHSKETPVPSKRPHLTADPPRQYVTLAEHLPSQPAEPVNNLLVAANENLNSKRLCQQTYNHLET